MSDRLVDNERLKLKLDCGNKLIGVACFWMTQDDSVDSPGICYACYVKRDGEMSKEIEKALGDSYDEDFVSFFQLPSYIKHLANAQFDAGLEAAAKLLEENAEAFRAAKEHSKTYREGSMAHQLSSEARHVRELKRAKPPTEREQVRKLVLEFFADHEDKGELWFCTRNPMFGGLTPDQVLEARPGKVLKIVKLALEENER